MNRRLLNRWMPRGRVGSALKTDLFDETVSEGLYPLLAAGARSVAGIDLSPSTAHGAGERYPGLLALQADVRRLPFEDARFDLVVSNSTLDHLESREEIAVAVNEIRRVLKVGGRLLLTLDNPTNPVVAVRNALPFRWTNRVGLTPYPVGATCGRARLCAMLASAGFDVLQSTAVMHCPRVVAVALARLVQRAGGSAAQRSFLRALLQFERLERLPTRFVTGHFVVAVAVKRRVHAGALEVPVDQPSREAGKGERRPVPSPG